MDRGHVSTETYSVPDSSEAGSFPSDDVLDNIGGVERRDGYFQREWTIFQTAPHETGQRLKNETEERKKKNPKTAVSIGKERFARYRGTLWPDARKFKTKREPLVEKKTKLKRKRVLLEFFF